MRLPFSMPLYGKPPHHLATTVATTRHLLARYRTGWRPKLVGQ